MLNLSKDEFKALLLNHGGFRTGSRAWKCETSDSDDDVVDTAVAYATEGRARFLRRHEAGGILARHE